LIAAMEEYAMQDSSTAPGSILQFRQDVQAKLRDGVRRAIETVLKEELLTALGADAHERTAGRRGYRHGTVDRTVTTREGTRTVTVPRGRVGGPADGPTEFHSTVLPRYARRTREVDEALLGCYFGGVNSRRIRTALKPLFGAAHLSKSAVSRVVARVKAQFLTWQERPLGDERYAVLFLDGFHLRVRLAGRVVCVPVLRRSASRIRAKNSSWRCSWPRPRRPRRGAGCSPICTAGCRRRCSSSPMAMPA
jgi:transposase-like protein